MRKIGGLSCDSAEARSLKELSRSPEESECWPAHRNPPPRANALEEAEIRAVAMMAREPKKRPFATSYRPTAQRDFHGRSGMMACTGKGCRPMKVFLVLALVSAASAGSATALTFEESRVARGDYDTALRGFRHLAEQ